MLSKVKPKTEPVVAKVAKPFYAIPPNYLTVIGLAFPFLFLYSMLNQNYFYAAIFIILSVFDTLDGVVARETGNVTKFGGVLDSSLDRIADGIYISAFGFAGIVDWWLIISLLIASYMVSYIRSRAELAGKGGFKLDIGVIERSERIIFLLLGVILLYFGLNQLAYYLFLFLLLLSIITIIQRFSAAEKKLS